MFSRLFILLIALLVDRFSGEPEWLWKRIPHPVVWMGKAIEWVEHWLLKDGADPHSKRVNGFLALLLLLAIAATSGWLIAGVFAVLPVVGVVGEIAVVSVFLAQRSLADHVTAVVEGLRSGGLSGGRDAVSKIVGRDPQALDEPAICRAAIESLAENASDGVVAPAFWYVIAGLPGLVAYKMLNTADSMIGHKSSRYLDFGRATALTDDVANWVPARLTGLLTISAAWIWNGQRKAREAALVMLREARQHRSPNAGWPEAAFGAVLGLALGGPRIYDGEPTTDPYVNGGGRTAANVSDIEAALVLFWRMCTVLAVLVLALMFAT